MANEQRAIAKRSWRQRFENGALTKCEIKKKYHHYMRVGAMYIRNKHTHTISTLVRYFSHLAPIEKATHKLLIQFTVFYFLLDVILLCVFCVVTQFVVVVILSCSLYNLQNYIERNGTRYMSISYLLFLLLFHFSVMHSVVEWSACVSHM